MESNVYVLESRLKRAGFTVFVAADGLQGVAVATAEQPHLILMDLGLPVLDGWEATRRLKALPATRHIPIIALSAHARRAGESARGRLRRFDTKPVDIPRLLQKIRALLPGGQTS
jgi:two-component system cell cycle response regulator DivK